MYGGKLYETKDEAFDYGEKYKKCIVIYKDEVFDLTDFAFKHPGGKSTLLGYSGRIIDNILFNSNVHKHS
jgi:cytochrome b involved in lipid metabolism